MKHKWWQALLMLVTSLSLCVIFSEVALRLFGIGYGNSPMIPDPVLHHIHPESYSFVFHIPSGEFGGHLIHYNEQGLTYDPDLPPPPNADHRIAFMGDSFVEAKQVPYKKTFVGELSTCCGNSIDVRNYGVSSYSPVLYALQWEKAVRPFRPSHVILMLYANDVDNDRDYSAEAKRDSDDQIIAVPGPKKGSLVHLLRKSYLLRLLRKAQLQIEWRLSNSEKGLQAGQFIEPRKAIEEITSSALKQLQHSVAQTGAEFILTAVPSQADLERQDKHKTPSFATRVQQWAAQNGVQYLDLTGAFESHSGPKLFFETDIHFTEEAHSVVAKTIRAQLPEVFSDLSLSNSASSNPK